MEEPIDGWLGLAKNVNNFTHLESASVNTTKGYVTAMKEARLIEQDQFSFYFSLEGSSYVDFGQYEQTSIKDGAEIKYIDTFDEFFWSMDCKAIGVLK